MISLMVFRLSFYLVHNFETSQTHPEPTNPEYPLPVFVKFYITHSFDHETNSSVRATIKGLSI
jgi:hypothetical protein